MNYLGDHQPQWLARAADGTPSRPAEKRTLLPPATTGNDVRPTGIERRFIQRAWRTMSGFSASETHFSATDSQESQVVLDAHWG